MTSSTSAPLQQPSPYYPKVPKDLQANLQFRKSLIQQGANNRDEQQKIWTACKRDLLFYVNSMCWTFSPKDHPENPILPMITWPYQDEALLKINWAIDAGTDLLIEKSRDMGASWLTLLVLEWRWKFLDMQTFMVLSRKEDLVDKAAEPDCLFWKLDFIIDKQPAWMTPGFNPAYHRNRMSLENPARGGTIMGDSTTGDVGRGGRKTALFLDEFGSVAEGEEVLKATSDTTNCRIFNSTPKGTANSFYKQRQRKDITVLRFHWTQHPEKAAGLYVDKETKKPRSPWYDKQCLRRSVQEVAQELDINYQGSDYQYFNIEIIDKHQKQFARRPNHQGDIVFDQETLEFKEWIERENGPLRLWFNLSPQNRPPSDRTWVFGADIATGSGSSNSTLSGADKTTAELTVEYADPHISPEKFARKSIAICKWFPGADGRGAHLIFESNGPGVAYGRKVVELGYGNIYYRTNEASANRKPSNIPGWFSNDQTKEMLFEEYRGALGEMKFVNHSLESLDECRAYIRSNGTIVHSDALGSSDPTGARDNHGDRTISAALCWWAMRAVERKQKTEKEIPQGSFMERRLKRQQQDREQRYAW